MGSRKGCGPLMEMSWDAGICASPPQVAQWYRIRLPLQEMPEVRVRTLGQEDPLEEENGNSLQYSFLENPMDRGVWRAI